MAQGFSPVAIDLATGARVRLRLEHAGTRTEQQTWTEACVRERAEGTLVDYGFVGVSLRFEARARMRELQRNTCDQAAEKIPEWLEDPRPSSSRILRLAELPDARMMRQSGFVPCDLALFDSSANVGEVAAALAGRSVVLLDPRGLPMDIALAVLRLCRVGVRDFRVLARKNPPKICRVMKAAEGRAAYGGRPPIADPRAAQMILDVERLSMRGRHAAVERTLRGAVAAFDRRGDTARAGDAGLRLGHLLLSRGRAADAKTVFTDAHDRFQRARAAEPALEAMAYVGLAETDLAQLEDAEKSCRSSYSAALALGRRELALFPATALARIFLWQKRYADARSILEAVEPVGDAERCARYWCLAARLQIAVGAIADAWRAVERARSGASGTSPVIEAIVRECEAAVQGKLGDLEALRIHVTNGLSAARAAHLPLLAIKLRLGYVEGLNRAGRFGQARTAARHLRGIRGSAIPPLLRSRIDQCIERAQQTSFGARVSSALSCAECA